jgi:hypothetical protein
MNLSKLSFQMLDFSNQIRSLSIFKKKLTQMHNTITP